MEADFKQANYEDGVVVGIQAVTQSLDQTFSRFECGSE